MSCTLGSHKRTASLYKTEETRDVDVQTVPLLRSDTDKVIQLASATRRSLQQRELRESKLIARLDMRPRFEAQTSPPPMCRYKGVIHNGAELYFGVKEAG